MGDSETQDLIDKFTYLLGMYAKVSDEAAYRKFLKGENKRLDKAISLANKLMKMKESI